MHFSTWSGGFFRDPVDSFFPGVIVLALAGLALWRSLRRREPAETSPVTSRRVLMLVAIAAAGFVLSLGTRTPVYGWLFHVFPPMQGLRAAARFGNLFLLGMAGLAGLGLAGLMKRLPAHRATLVGIVLVAAANVESLRAPFPYTRFEGIPGIYSMLAEEPGRVVLAETPFYPPQAVFENAALRPGVDGSLAAAHERLQRLRARARTAPTRPRSGSFRRTSRSRKCGKPA